MTTQIIGIKEFRDNITKLWKTAKNKKVRYIVMHHSTPVLEVNPIHNNRLVLENFTTEIQEARNQVKSGDVYSQEEVFKMLDL